MSAVGGAPVRSGVRVRYEVCLVELLDDRGWWALVPELGLEAFASDRVQALGEIQSQLYEFARCAPGMVSSQTHLSVVAVEAG